MLGHRPTKDTAHRPHAARAVAGVAVLVAVLLGGCASLPGSPSDDASSPGTGSPSTPADPATPPPTSDDASPAPQADGLVADLTVEVDLTGEGPAETWTLTCGPAGGDHPDPDGACAALADAGGADALAPPPAGQMCTQQYGGPEVATVTGTVDGRRVARALDRTDGCGIGDWQALVPLVPEPTGR